jgi:hypothetical protein
MLRLIVFVLLMSMLCLDLLTQVHLTYLWHLEEPIYWPAPDSTLKRYQRAWESILAKRNGATHPQDDLQAIFSKHDRVPAYQYRPWDSLQTLLFLLEAGVQITYSGSLIQNIQSVASVSQLGYTQDWNQSFRRGRNLLTQQGTPRMDILLFPFHHPLMSLIDERVLWMEVALYKALYEEVFGTTPVSKGFFPPERAFSETLIPVFKNSGVEWGVVSNSHLSRACKDYPYVAGSGGDNIPPPSKADQLNPAQGKCNRMKIDHGVSPANAYPFAYTPHKAQFVDPETGEVFTLIVVPAAHGESWKDGYSCYGLDDASVYAGEGSPEHPILVVLAHDGDNAFGGGYSYYMECVPSLAHSALAKGFVLTTIQAYLNDHPVSSQDIVHVEDGAWVNANGDFGAPAFWNWNWPLMNQADEVHTANGWTEDERNFAVIIAATNLVPQRKMLQDIRTPCVSCTPKHPMRRSSSVRGISCLEV